MAHATSETPAPLTLHGLSVEGVNQCVHCGLCLASCPTFSELGTEMDSPRGRIVLIRSLAEGRIGLSDSTVQHLSLCLDCRACETVCPAGVPYGRLIEAAKAEIERQRPGGPVRRAFRWINFDLLLRHPRMLPLAAAGLRLYPASRLQALVRTSGASEGERVAAIVVNTSGCGAHMKAYGTLLAEDPAWAERARRFAATVRDVAEFLAGAALRGPLQPVPMTVTYHDPCHVVHGQKIRTAPRALLAQIPGLRVVDLPESDWCCGSAGIYNLTQPEMAGRLLRRKVRHVLGTGASAVVTANPGCILQIQQGLHEAGSPVRVLHIVAILDRAYSSEARCAALPNLPPPSTAAKPPLERGNSNA